MKAHSLMRLDFDKIKDLVWSETCPTCGYRGKMVTTIKQKVITSLECPRCWNKLENGWDEAVPGKILSLLPREGKPFSWIGKVKDSMDKYIDRT